ncbi:MAG: hypothetical protein QM784_15035 [Polyangiaceae bacterium]
MALIEFCGVVSDRSEARVAFESSCHRRRLPQDANRFADKTFICTWHSIGRDASGPVGTAESREPYVVVDGWLRLKPGSVDEERREAGDDDASLVRRAYERWDIEFADRIEGEFAVVVWDARKRVLMLVRDAAGVRPLHWAPLTGGGSCVRKYRVFRADASGDLPSPVGTRSGGFSYWRQSTQ